MKVNPAPGMFLKPVVNNGIYIYIYLPYQLVSRISEIQIGSFLQVGVNIKNIWNHYPVSQSIAEYL